MIETRVFDQTAITALFRGNRRAFANWQDADAGTLTLILPAVAVAEANTAIGGNSDTWRAILHPGRVIVTPLDESTAIEVGTAVGSLAVRHVIREASHTEGDIVTEAPWQYSAGSPPLLTL
ncbi:hypothetical protein GCM10009557_21650 [Virgisporangium ochraceum]|uniref:Uncharacterized protein n=1 Tax=Virgisporangium ochraceum TaxID=65505 RepID=A0A8J3ZRW2_9ACTN|nr:hypothetical protein [Virgisporangium ochraceum]GIJ66366.1 hypothetical protein Voc01_012830 [Virgisporangium ochraceum]